MTYGLKEYKALLEKNMLELSNPSSVPFGVDPNSHEGVSYRRNKMESFNYAIEMLPDIKEPMKDHEFAECVNELREICKAYGSTEQLRGRLAIFLQDFREKMQ